MRLPIWYVLASNGEREHRDLVLASARTLRHVDRACRLGLALDPESAESAVREGVSLGELFDEVRIDRSGEPSAMERSRSIKVRLRLETRGDFCYVDSDTLAVRPLNIFPTLATGVGMVPDFIPGYARRFGPPESARAKFERIGWPFPVPRYFNGGVIVWRDRADAYSLAETWYRNWRTSVAAGVPQDQPALGHSDRELGGVVSELPKAFNAQVRAWPGFARNAAIWHFFYSQADNQPDANSILDVLLQDVARDQPLRFDQFDRARRRNFPWVRSQGFTAYATTGNYFDAARELPSMALRLLARTFSRSA